MAGAHHPDHIDACDLGVFLKKRGYDFSPDDLYHLRTAYDKQRRGCINYTDFLQQTMDVTKPVN